MHTDNLEFHLIYIFYLINYIIFLWSSQSHGIIKFFKNHFYDWVWFCLHFCFINKYGGESGFPHDT